MKASIIPPIPHLDLASTFQTHLLLDHLYHDHRYQEFYLDRRAKGDFLIWDNSAHEFGKGNSPEHLLDHAIFLNAQEIVVPDALFDGFKTLLQAKQAFEFFEIALTNYCPRLMIVPQAENYEDWRNCFHNLLTEYDRFGYDKEKCGLTLGLSKDYEIFEGGLYKLLAEDLIPEKRHRGPDCQIHMLGWGRDLWGIEPIIDEFGGEIRSIDSAKPIVFGLNGIKLIPGKGVPYPKRPPDYFNTSFWNQGLASAKISDLIEENIRTFRAFVEQ